METLKTRLDKARERDRLPRRERLSTAGKASVRGRYRFRRL
jgi:hypothetical protein